MEAKTQEETNESPQAIRARLLKEGKSETYARAESTKKPAEKKSEEVLE